MLLALPGQAQVALLGGGVARPLRGQFNSVPVLHSNQPEEVTGPGILIDTSPGSALAAETGEMLANATYRFEGPFGLHLHHKYAAPPQQRFIAPGQRRDLHLAAVLTNPGQRPVRIQFESGAVRNSFEAPYLGASLMGVKPLGPRPWNTGPGDATAVQLLRGRLDAPLSEPIVIPPRQRLVLFSTRLPALGVANALLKGVSDGPFEMAVVAAPAPGDDASVLATLDSRRLAPGRTYLSQLEAIRSREVFARVAGVALGDTYTATLRHDLERDGPLHVPLTSTVRTEFGSGEVQVNPLVSRMVDSSLDNVGTYGVRFDIDLDLIGRGAYALVLSHPSDRLGRVYTAFRGSIAIITPEAQRDVHVGMRSGESLPLASLQLQPGSPRRVRISLVYPADATPGHLLSVLSEAQLAQIQEQKRLVAAARPAAATPARLRPKLEPQAALGRPVPLRQPSAAIERPVLAARPKARSLAQSPQPLRPPRRVAVAPIAAPLRPPASLSWRNGNPSAIQRLIAPPRREPRRASPTDDRRDGTLADRYRQAVEAQDRVMRSWSTP